jgi:catechol 2,3-dioxygenase-like lactoylglutathione lyase family enzyme
MASSTPPAAKITSLDHLVLTVSSIPSTQKWYEKNLGMKPESFVSAAAPEITRHSLIFGQQKINLHQLGKVTLHFCSSPSLYRMENYGERERDLALSVFLRYWKERY